VLRAEVMQQAAWGSSFPDAQHGGVQGERVSRRSVSGNFHAQEHAAPPESLHVITSGVHAHTSAAVP